MVHGTVIIQRFLTAAQFLIFTVFVFAAGVVWGQYTADAREHEVRSLAFDLRMCQRRSEVLARDAVMVREDAARYREEANR